MQVTAKTRYSNALLMMIASAACWGLGTVVSKGAILALPPLTVLVIQLASSTVFLWTIALCSSKSRSQMPTPKTFWRYGLPGLLEPGLSYILGLTGLAMTTASNGTLISSTEPAIILGLSWILLKEKVRPVLLGVAAMAIVGVLLTVGVDLQAGNRSVFGDLLLVAGTGCGALYAVLSQSGVQHLRAVSLAAIQQSVGLIEVLIVWLSFGQANAVQIISISPASWSLAIASGIVQYALAFWVYLQAVKTLPLSIAAQFLSLIPVFGVSGAYLFLGERLTLLQGLGMTIAIASVAGITQIQQEKNDDSTH